MYYLILKVGFEVHIISVLQMRRLRCRKVKYVAQTLRLANGDAGLQTSEAGSCCPSRAHLHPSLLRLSFLGLRISYSLQDGLRPSVSLLRYSVPLTTSAVFLDFFFYSLNISSLLKYTIQHGKITILM